ncbi:MAG: DNA repair protein RecN [Proteobacteria bacterium]|nr:DNA repair protein RecN [Pseudomonadota bacterium]
MLKSMYIKNFAIIDELQLDLGLGFIVLTGETGAGKSIIFDAIQLLVGARGGTELIRRGYQQALIEGEFSLSPKQLSSARDVLEEYGIVEPQEDIPDCIVVRRILSHSSSRVFVNGVRVSLKILNRLMSSSVDIIGQHASHALLSSENHLPILDLFAKTEQQASDVAAQVRNIKKLEQEISDLQNKARERNARQRYLQDQFDLILKTALVKGEDERLEADLDKMLNAELLKNRAQTALSFLQDGNGSAMDLLSSAIDQIRRIAHLDDQIQASLDIFERTNIELSEAIRDLRPFTDGGMFSAADIEDVQERLEVIKDLKERYGGSIEAVLLAQTKIEGELELLQSESDRISSAKEELESAYLCCMKDAMELSKQRQSAAQMISSLVETELKQLGMEHCQFKVSQMLFRDHPDQGLEQTDIVEEASRKSLTLNGLDKIEFLISPNVGEGFKPMAKVASGGELSRILLALKGALIKVDPVESYIFDEVDTGIGGGIAEIVGRKLQSLGGERQVLCITHLPQVASCAHKHLYVSKDIERVDGKERTRSSIRYLTWDERINEVARMLGGAELTQMTRAHAQELMENNQTSDKVVSLSLVQG